MNSSHFWRSHMPPWGAGRYLICALGCVVWAFGALHIFFNFIYTPTPWLPDEWEEAKEGKYLWFRNAWKRVVSFRDPLKEIMIWGGAGAVIAWISSCL